MSISLPATVLADLSDLLAMRIGLHFPKKRWNDLERGIRAIAPVLGAADALSCAYRLLSIPWSRREIEVLASRLTIGETYFFREKTALEAFERSIVPALLDKRRSGLRRLRVWSAGCCTGEEPYSVAMLLDRLIPDPEHWDLTLLATDINPDFLRKAIRGEYSEWSFRGAPRWIRQRYFHTGPAGRLRLDERIRKRVQFASLNLADDLYPSAANNTQAMDVIFCRNVLMYFTPRQARQVVDKLYSSLIDGGWLIVSPAEATGTLFSRFRPVQHGGVTLFQKSVQAEPVAPVASPYGEVSPVVSLSPEQFLPVSETGARSEATSVPGQVTEPGGKGHTVVADASLDRTARDLANQGRLDEALTCCQALVDANKMNPAHHYLLATIQHERGKVEDAIRSLGRALYLDRSFILAYFALGNLFRSQGKPGEAQKQFDNALELLRTLPKDQVVPESEGLTAGHLGEIIQSLMSATPVQVSHQ